jgi:hypothetical protein
MADYEGIVHAIKRRLIEEGLVRENFPRRMLTELIPEESEG